MAAIVTMSIIETPRLRISPFSHSDFEIFVGEMLTDPRVVEFYYSYGDLNDLEAIRNKAKSDFWDEFEASRDEYAWQRVCNGIREGCSAAGGER